MERWEKSLNKFIKHFEYVPECPKKLFEINEIYPDVLEKSVKDDIDYTISKYGTVPNKKMSGKPGAIILD